MHAIEKLRGISFPLIKTIAPVTQSLVRNLIPWRQNSTKKGTEMCLLTASSLKGTPFKRCRLHSTPGVARPHWGLSCTVRDSAQTLSRA